MRDNLPPPGQKAPKYPPASFRPSHYWNNLPERGGTAIVIVLVILASILIGFLVGGQ